MRSRGRGEVRVGQGVCAHAQHAELLCAAAVRARRVDFAPPSIPANLTATDCWTHQQWTPITIALLCMHSSSKGAEHYPIAGAAMLCQARLSPIDTVSNGKLC